MNYLLRKAKNIIIFNLVIISSMIAQRTHIDQKYLEGLKNNLQVEKDLLEKARIYNKIATEYIIIQSIDSVKYYSEKALGIASENDFDYEAAIAYKNIAIASSANIDRRDYNTIKKDYYVNINNAIAIFSRINDKKNLAACYRYLSRYYLEYHNNSLFLENNSKSISLYKELSDSTGIASCYLDLGKVYSIQKKYDMAEHLFKIGAGVFEKARDTLSLITLYSNYSYLKKFQRDYTGQLVMAKKAYELAEKIQNKKIIAFAYSDYGEALNHNNQPKEAIKILKAAILYAHEYNADILATQVFKNLARSYLLLKDYSAAFMYQDSSLTYFKSNTRKANQEISEYEKYEREIEKKRLEEQSEKVKRTYIVIVLFVLLLLLSFIYFQRQRAGKLLQEKIHIIDGQNFELQEINHQLEDIVKERTNDLYQKNVELKVEIERRKQVEAELISAKELADEGNNLKSTLLSNISHEFRTPLNGILGFVEILKDELAGSELNEFVLKIGRSGKRLLNTLNSVLTIMEITSENYYSECSSVDLNSFCDGLAGNYHTLASSKSIGLSVEHFNGDASLCIDKNILTRALQSIIDNAIKYTYSGSVLIKIFRSEEPGNKEFAVSVIDTGIGIMNQDKVFLFKEFKQLSEGYSRSYEGLGLGLALSEKMIKLIGGRITCESEFGKGSVFTVWLPVIDQPDLKNGSDRAAADKSQLITAFKNPLKILLVEDNDLNAEVVSRFVASFGTVDIAEDAESALKLVALKQYDLMLIDINLGAGANGVELLNEIMKKENYKNVPSIALTGYAYSRSKNEFKNYGFTDYLAKPVEKTDLIKLINEVLNVS